MGKRPELIFFQLRNYIAHRCTARSTKGHGIHSPFIYELATTVLPDKKPEWCSPIEEIRKDLLNDHRVIQINDLGAGSRVSKSNERRVSDIAKYSLQKGRISRLLYRLAVHCKSRQILELGTSLGLTTAHLAQANVPVTTIEGCSQIAQIAQSNFSRLNISNITLKIGNFDDLLPGYLQEHDDCNFVFVDGNHSYSATMRYFRQLTNHLTTESVIIFDDIYWSKEMQRAWNEIVADSSNQITVDLFHFGIVFFREGQAKEHFKIRL